MLIWKDPIIETPPPRQNLLVYRGDQYRHPTTGQMAAEQRGVNQYDVDQFTDLDDHPWAYRLGTGTYTHYCCLPPYPEWAQNDLPKICAPPFLVCLKTGQHRGEFLVGNAHGKCSAYLGSAYNGGWLPFSENQVLCWLPVPEPPSA